MLSFFAPADPAAMRLPGLSDASALSHFRPIDGLDGNGHRPQCC